MRWSSRLLCAVFLMVAGTAQGQDCSVSAVPVQFGQYIALDPSPVDAVGSIKVACTAGEAFTVRLDSGESSAGNFHPRKLRSTATGHVLNYNLYRDSARTEVWGDGTGNTFVQSGVGTGGEIVLTAYGRLPGGQNVGAGFYRDSITVTVEW